MNGVYHLHKPLLQLIALSRCFYSKDRLAEFCSYEVSMSEFVGISEKVRTEYPFGRLIHDELWQVENYSNLSKNTSGDLIRSELLENRVRGGLPDDIYEVLLNDLTLLILIFSKLLKFYFPPEQHVSICLAVNLPINNLPDTSKMNNEIIEISTVNDNQKYSGNSIDSYQNNYINYLNSIHNLRANAANALAESQALNSYFPDLYQPFPLVDEIVKALTIGTDKVIVLTGHAGDGKSTVALDVFKQLNKLPANEPLAQALKMREDVSFPNGKKVFIVKDMSELAAMQRLAWLKNGFSEAGSWLIVSNTGPLLNSLAAYVDDLKISPIESKVLDLLDQTYVIGNLDKHSINDLGKELVILNMTRLDNVTLGAGLLTKMVNHPAWEHCVACPSESSCPIKRNRQAIQEASDVIELRVRLIYQRLTSYECRLTLRQMVAHLALSLTGGIGCSQAHTFASEATSSLEGLEGIVFSESFFGYQKNEPWVEAKSLRAVALVHRLVFGGPTAPDFERELTTDQGSSGFTLPSSLSAVRLHWARRAKDFSGVRWRYALRRMTFLFGMEKEGSKLKSDIFLDTFLQSPRLRDFDQWREADALTLTSGASIKLTKDCLQVLLEVFSGFSAGQFNFGHDRLYLTLRRSDNAVVQVTQLVVAVFDFSQFKLIYDRLHQIPVLLYMPHPISLPLSLPLLDYIHIRSAGSLGDGLAPIHLAKLECFRAELLCIAKQGNSVSGQIGLLRSGIDGNVALHRYVLDEENQRLERQ